MPTLDSYTALPDYSEGRVQGYYVSSECRISAVKKQVEVINYVDSSDDVPMLENMEARFEMRKETGDDYVQDINYLRNYNGTEVIAQFNVYFWGYTSIDTQWVTQGSAKNTGLNIRSDGFPATIRGGVKNGIASIFMEYAKGVWEAQKEAMVGDGATDKLHVGVVWAHPHPNVFKYFYFRSPSERRCWYAMSSVHQNAAVLEVETQTVTEV